MTQLERQLTLAIQNLESSLMIRLEKLETQVDQIGKRQDMLAQELQLAHGSVDELERLQCELEMSLRR